MSGFPEKILIIDDDHALLEVEELALKRFGDIEVQLCDSCDQAVTAIENFTPELILLDLKMPDKDGTEAVRELRKIEKISGTPIIFVTGEHRVIMQDDYKVLGVIGIIYKPFKPSDFITGIQDLWHMFQNP